MPHLPYDRALIAIVTETDPSAAGTIADLALDVPGGDGPLTVTAVVGRRHGFLSIADTVSARHIPYAAATRAPRALGQTDRMETPHLDLLRIRAIPRWHLGGLGLAQAPEWAVERDLRYQLVLAAGEDAFDHGLGGDARRWRGLQREFGVALHAAADAPERQRIAGEIATMFAERAALRGLATDADLALNGRVAVALAADARARAFALRDGEGRLVAGTLGLSVGRTFFGLMAAGIDEGAIARKSPARLVKLAALNALAAEGVTTYDFGIGATPEKRQICNLEETVYDLFVPLTSAGRMAGALMAASMRARRGARPTCLMSWALALRHRLHGTLQPAA